jgi:hypothetical protein
MRCALATLYRDKIFSLVCSYDPLFLRTSRSQSFAALVGEGACNSCSVSRISQQLWQEELEMSKWFSFLVIGNRN